MKRSKIRLEDIAGFFDSIDHEILYALLVRKFKDRRLLSLIRKIIVTYHSMPGQGLPIGALTSQNFANYYLTIVDRYLLETCKVAGMVRYMDDVVWWCREKETAKAILERVQSFLFQKLALEIKPTYRINQSRYGLGFCGYRIFPGTVRLNQRRKSLYKAACRHWEAAFGNGFIQENQLQLCPSSCADRMVRI